MVQLLIRTGFWPHDLPFETKELMTVIDEYERMNRQAKKARRAN